MKTQSLFILLFLVPILLPAQQNAESVVASGFMVGNCNELFVNATIGQLLISGGTCGDFIV